MKISKFNTAFPVFFANVNRFIAEFYIAKKVSNVYYIVSELNKIRRATQNTPGIHTLSFY